MKLIGIRVKDKKYGAGTIVDSYIKKSVISDTWIIVEYDTKETKKYAYPKAFDDGFLKCEKLTIQNQIEIDSIAIREEKAKIDEQKQKEKEQERVKKKQEEETKRLQYSKKTRNKSPKKVKKAVNFAIKCNFCDGNSDDNKIGFSGICTDKIIDNNIRIEKRSWCNQKECLCNQYYQKNINRTELDESYYKEFVCYESKMLVDWTVYAGTNTNGIKKGTFRKIAELDENKLCILTTIDPKINEGKRFIFALFIIGECNEGNNEIEGYLKANPDYTITFNCNEAHKFLFWDYYKNPNSPNEIKWGSGLYRKLTDEQAINILNKAIEIKKGTEQEEQAIRIKNYYIKQNNKNNNE